jgi:hypothetical protein
MMSPIRVRERTLNWDAGMGGVGTGFWNILVNSPGCPGDAGPAGAADGAAAGLLNARVNSPGGDAGAGAGDSTGFAAGAATGSGAWRNSNIRVKSPGGCRSGGSIRGLIRHAPTESRLSGMVTT